MHYLIAKKPHLVYRKHWDKFIYLFEPSSRQNTEYPVTSDDPVWYGGCHDNVTNLFETIAAMSLVGGVGGSGLVGVPYPRWRVWGVVKEDESLGASVGEGGWWGGKRDKKQPSKPKHNTKSNDSAKAKTIYKNFRGATLVWSAPPILHTMWQATVMGAIWWDAFE